jgi:hypothetical protein
MSAIDATFTRPLPALERARLARRRSTIGIPVSSAFALCKASRDTALSRGSVAYAR